MARPPVTTANMSMARAGTHTAEMLPPRRSPSPRRNHAWGATKVSRDSTPGAWETGKNVPPTRPRMTATTDCQLAACSAFLARVAIRAMIPVAARIAATTSTATPSGFPQDAPNSKVVATASTVMLMTPSRKLVSSFPPRIEARLIGAASSRASVPSLRSSSRLVTPNWTVKNRKNTAIPAAKNDFWSSSFVCADTSLTATGAAAAAARAASAWICAGDSGVVPAATVATDSRIRFRSAAKLSVIDRATSVEMGASTLPMTCIEAGWPAWTRAEKPAGMTMTAASFPFAASARAWATVASGWMAITPLRPTAGRTWPVNCWLTAP